MQYAETRRTVDDDRSTSFEKVFEVRGINIIGLQDYVDPCPAAFAGSGTQIR